MYEETMDKIRNPVDDFLNRIDIIVNEKYIQLFIYRQFGGIRTMEYIRTLAFMQSKQPNQI